MKQPEEIKITDIQRILFGEVPYHFLIEVVFRSLFIYLLLMIAMRLMGKRMASHLSRNEMAAISSLAAAIGIPLMNPDKGILPAVIIAIVIVLYQHFISRRAVVDKKFEAITQDRLAVLVKDGVLDTTQMMRTRISRARIFSQLRSEGIAHLGMVKRLYFEAGGSFSVLKSVADQPGLSVLPTWDQDLISQMEQVPATLVCGFCGYANPNHAQTPCLNCKRHEWTVAVR